MASNGLQLRLSRAPGRAVNLLRDRKQKNLPQVSFAGHLRLAFASIIESSYALDVLERMTDILVANSPMLALETVDLMSHGGSLDTSPAT